MTGFRFSPEQTACCTLPWVPAYAGMTARGTRDFRPIRQFQTLPMKFRISQALYLPTASFTAGNSTRLVLVVGGEGCSPDFGAGEPHHIIGTPVGE